VSAAVKWHAARESLRLILLAIHDKERLMQTFAELTELYAIKNNSSSNSSFLGYPGKLASER